MKLEEIASGWTPPDGLGYSGLRPVSLSRAGYALTALAAVFVIGGAVMGVVIWNKSQGQAARRDLLRRQGAVAEARVIRLWHDDDKSPTPMVSYRFEAEGAIVGGSSSVPSNTWSAMHTGDALAVRYVPGQAAINHPAAWEMSVVPVWVSLLMPGMFWFGALMLALTVQRQSRLLAEGRPAPGVVVKVRRNDKQLVASYEFRLLNGAVQKGRGSVRSRSAPAIGSVVCVMYDPENPRRNALYPFQFVRLEGLVKRR